MMLATQRRRGSARRVLEYATTEKLLGHRLHGMGEQYIHNWNPKLRAAVTVLEKLVVRKLREAAKDERVCDTQEATPAPVIHHQHTLPPWWECIQDIDPIHKPPWLYNQLKRSFP